MNLTAPEFIEGYPVVGTVEDNNIEIRVKSNEEGKTFVVIVNNEATAPTAEEIKAGINYGSVELINAANTVLSVDVESIIDINNLTANTDYDVYVIIEDEHENLQETVVKLDVKTQNTTSIEDIDAEVTIFPNPAKDYIRISSNENVESYVLLNAIGNVVRIGKDVDRPIHVSSLKSGVYFIIVKMYTGDEIVKKIVLR